jgi:uncharacterized protein (TIGR02117 family)
VPDARSVLGMRRVLGWVVLLLAVTPAGADEARVIHVVGHGWHVGLALARADVPAALWPEIGGVAGRYVEVGWGEGAYYPAADPGVGAALKAALASESSVLHVAGFDQPAPEFFAGATVVAVSVSARGIEALSRFIHEHYARDDAGRAVVVAPGRYGDARFYRATGRYRLFDNSNTWAAKALQAAGCPIDAATVTAGSVLRQVKALEPGACR